MLKHFLETMISHRPKQMFLKLELYTYDPEKQDFAPIKSAIIEQKELSHEVERFSGTLTMDSKQDVKQILELSLANGEGQNNWTAFFNPDNEFKWWLDKRLKLYIGLKLDKPYTDHEGKLVEVEFISKGYFAITNFQNIHTLSEYPITKLTCSSLEVLYTGRRGKFLNPYTIVRNSVGSEVVRTLIRGEIPSKYIRIDADLGERSHYLEQGGELNKWSLGSGVTAITSDESMYPGSPSIKFTISGGYPRMVAEKTLDSPIPFREIDALSMWVRCSTDLEGGDMYVEFEDTMGNKARSSFLQLVGHIVKGEEVVETDIDNWRNMLLSFDDTIDLINVNKMRIYTSRFIQDDEFHFWLDTMYASQMKNMLPYELTYGAGTSKWAAITELADIMNCESYFDVDGNFIFEKRKIPSPRDAEEFNFDRYEVLDPVITFSDTQRKNNLYAGNINQFEEHELSNHVQVLGGSTSYPITTTVEMALYSNGLHIQEKGMRVNKRGKVRAIDNFGNPYIIYSDSSLEELYKHDKKLDDYKDLPAPPMEKPPISNFAIERVGNMIYHHNNATHDPLVLFTYEAKNRALWELKKRMGYSQLSNLIIAPYYTLNPLDIIRIEDSLLEVNDNFEIRSITIPLSGDYMQVTANKIRAAVFDLPFFDEDYLKHNSSWYGYDFYGLTFTFPLFGGV